MDAAEAYRLAALYEDSERKRRGDRQSRYQRELNEAAKQPGFQPGWRVAELRSIAGAEENSRRFFDRNQTPEQAEAAQQRQMSNKLARAAAAYGKPD
jgi:predicted alpha/beta-fold hydrolase